MQFNIFTKLTLTALVMLALSAYLPVFAITNVDAILASATFLYGVIYGFEISIVLGNFATLKAAIGGENAGLIAINNLANIIGGKFAKSVEANIEKYLLKAIDVPLIDHLTKTNTEFYAIFDALKGFNSKNDAEGAALNYINEGLYYIPQSRGQISAVAPRDIDPPEWVLLIILALIIIVALFLGREADMISRISAALFSTTVVGTLILLEEIDSNRIQEARLEYEVFNETLDAMGKKRYYPKLAIDSGSAKPPKGISYRTKY